MGLFNLFKKKSPSQSSPQEKGEDKKISDQPTIGKVDDTITNSPTDVQGNDKIYEVVDKVVDSIVEKVSEHTDEKRPQQAEQLDEIPSPQLQSDSTPKVDEPISPTNTPDISEHKIYDAVDTVVDAIVAQVTPQPEVDHNTVETPIVADQTPEKKKGFFSRLKDGLSKTRSKFGGGLGNLLLGQKIIDDELIDDIEMQLITADVGIDATEEIMEAVRGQVARNELQTMDALNKLLQHKLHEIIKPCEQPLVVGEHQPFVLLVVGVNGAGKTTTIGKLAKKFQQQGKSVMLAAGDTFRAAAVEQLKVWGERNNVPVIAQHTGADSASVIFDAVQAAKARGTDIIIADTAGRLQNKDNLMEELKKVARVMKKLDDTAPHEVMLVLDATTGQNALSQAEIFHKTIPITGITITKLDGTAKGGIIFAIAKKMGIPIRFIGIGEKIDDLRTFEAEDFISALFTEDK